MKRKAVFLAGSDNKMIERVFDSATRDRLATMAELYPEHINRENAALHREQLRNTEIAFSTWGIPPFTTEELNELLPDLKIILYAAGTVQHFARTYLSRNVTVISAWGANAVPVAEFTTAQILLANKGFLQAARHYTQKADFQGAKRIANSYPGNYGAKVGILGAGMIGKMVIERLRKHELTIDVFDPFLPDSAAEQMGVCKRDLVDIFSSCDTISNHLANLPATVGILNKEHFDRMLPHATFINTGRGAQLVEEDLIRALREVPTRTAILDVTHPEPVPQGSGFYQLDNVILTPHIAGSMNLEVARMGLYMAEECERFLAGQPLRYEVTPEMLETMA